MVFSSLLFLFRFLPAILLVYYIVPRQWRNLVLLLFSLAFYAWGEPIYIILMLASIVVSYIGGVLVDRFKQAEKMKAAKAALIISSAINLSLLAFFKYADFAIETVNSLTGTRIAGLQLALPIGISFYTFQTVSYIMDVYRGEAAVQKNPISFGTYVTMFPQLIAGPIVQYKTIDTQLRTRKETAEQFSEGIRRFMIGLGKKVLLANNVGALWEAIQATDSAQISVLTAWMGLAAYTFQIYFDFSGYSDMAIGLGRMLGFHFSENFEYPYISRSITEFWRRWHISLSTFFRDYVYIPLGGNRYHAIRNIFIVWLLTGLWHGASWNFIFWGLFYGVLLFIEKTLFKKKLQKIPAPICYIYTMFFIILGWALFYFTDLNALWTFIKSAFGVGTALYDLTAVSTFCTNAWLIAVCVIASTPIPTIIHKNFCKKSKVFAAISEPILVIVGLGVCFVLLVGQTYNPFLYFRF